MSDSKHLRCSFCGKSKDAVVKFIAGPGAYICNECVELCCEILGSEGVKPFWPDTFADVGPFVERIWADEYERRMRRFASIPEEFADLLPEIVQEARSFACEIMRLRVEIERRAPVAPASVPASRPLSSDTEDTPA